MTMLGRWCLMLSTKNCSFDGYLTRFVSHVQRTTPTCSSVQKNLKLTSQDYTVPERLQRVHSRTHVLQGLRFRTTTRVCSVIISTVDTIIQAQASQNQRNPSNELHFSAPNLRKRSPVVANERRPMCQVMPAMSLRALSCLGQMDSECILLSMRTRAACHGIRSLCRTLNLAQYPVAVKYSMLLHGLHRLESWQEKFLVHFLACFHLPHKLIDRRRLRDKDDRLYSRSPLKNPLDLALAPLLYIRQIWFHFRLSLINITASVRHLLHRNLHLNFSIRADRAHRLPKLAIHQCRAAFLCRCNTQQLLAPISIPLFIRPLIRALG